MPRRYLHICLGMIAVIACIAAALYWTKPPMRLAFTLSDETGATLRARDLPACPTAVFFGFAGCSTICPLALTTMSQAIRTLHSEQRCVNAVMITVDPKNDTPSRMKDYLSNLGGGIRGLTGSRTQLDKIFDALNVYAGTPQPVENTATLQRDHTPYIYIFAGNREYVTLLPSTVRADALANELRKLTVTRLH